MELRRQVSELEAQLRESQASVEALVAELQRLQPNNALVLSVLGNVKKKVGEGAGSKVLGGEGEGFRSGGGRF